MQPLILVSLGLCLAALLSYRKHGFLTEGAKALLYCLLLAWPLFVFTSSMIWTSLMAYDDEGYVLHSLKDFVQGGGLYDRVYSQYGPFYFLLWKGLNQLGVEITHDNGRLFTQWVWLACAGNAAFLAWRLSRNWVVSGASLAATCIYLWPMASEPSHPGSLVCLLALFGSTLLSQIREGSLWSPLGVGAIGAALFLTKINTGVFFVGGAVGYLCLELGNKQGKPYLLQGLRICTTLGLLLAPWLLIRALITQTAFWTFAAVCSLNLGALFIVRQKLSSPVTHDKTSIGLKAPLLIIGAFLISSSGVLLLALAGGSSIQGLLEGLFLAPLRFPDSFTTPINWRPGALFLAAAAPLLAWLLSKNNSAAIRILILILQTLSLLFFIASWAEIIPLPMQGYMMSYGLSSLWLFAIPSGTDQQKLSAGARLPLLAVMVVILALQAFPVGGSQIAWGTSLWIPMIAVAYSNRLKCFCSALPLPVQQWGGQALLATLILLLTLRHSEAARQRFEFGRPLDQPGASRIFAPERLANSIQILSANLRRYADCLFSEPGIYSFNLWAGIKTPTHTNATLWFRLLDNKQQLEILAKLEEHPNAIILLEESTLNYLKSRNIPVEGPLVEYINKSFRTELKLNNYTLLIKNTRHPLRLSGVLRRMPRPLDTQPLGPQTNSAQNVPIEDEYWTVHLEPKVLALMHSVDLYQYLADGSRLILSNKSIRYSKLSTGMPPSMLGVLQLQVPRLPTHIPHEDVFIEIKDTVGNTLQVCAFDSRVAN